MSRPAANGRWPPEPGSLYVFPETAGFPVEWAVLSRRPGDPGQVLAVPADTNPLAGSADVEIPPGEPSGPLNLRCRFGHFLDAARFHPDRRTGVLDPDAVARALAKRSELEAGEVHASPLAFEADADPEYEDWVRDVLVPAHAALADPAAQTAPSAALRPLRRWTTLGNPYALAASILLMATLGLASGLLWQRERMSGLIAERERTAGELRRERERTAAELRKTEEGYRREIEERDRQAAKMREEDRRRIAELETRLETAVRPRPLVNAPFAYLAPKEPTRGEPDGITLPPDARYLFLSLLITSTREFPEYRLEIREKDTGKLVWKADGLRKTVTSEVSVALPLPRDLLPPGDYEIRLDGLKDGKAERAGEYELRIAEE